MSNAKDKTPEQPKDTGKDVSVQRQNTSMDVVDLGDDAGQGMENMDSSELKIPFLYLLQTNSPQCKPVAAGGVPGAKAGMFMNGATGELYEGPLPFVPCNRDHKFIEYTPQNLGGGLVQIYEPDDNLVLELQAQHGKFGKLPRNITKRDQNGQPLDGTEIVETFTLACIFVPKDNTPFKAFVSFKSTQIPKYQTLMGRINDGIRYANPRSTPENPLPPQKPAIYQHLWDMESVYETKKKGEFYGFKLTLHAKNEDGTEMRPINSLLKKSDPLLEEAKAFYEFMGGTAVNYKNDKQGADAGEPGQKAGDETPM